MKLFKRSLICLSVAALITGCNDTEYVSVDSDYSPVVVEGKTLTNTPDVVVISDATDLTEITITIGATSDLHGRIFGYDYALDGEDDDAGITRVSTLLEQERAINPNMLLVDIGDTVQGNSAELFNSEPTHPVVESMNSLGFDAWVPGNHEFDFERAFIDRNLAHFNGAVLSSNIHWETNGVNYLRGYQIFEIDTVKVAVVGIIPSNIPNWHATSPGNFKGLEFGEELESTQAAVAELNKKHNPDVIVGAFHIGRKGEGGAGIHDIATAMVDQFDIILAGHEHANYIEQINPETGEIFSIATDAGDDIGGENSLVEDTTVSFEHNEAIRAQTVKMMEPGKWGAYLAKAEIKLEKVDGEWNLIDTHMTNIGTKKVAEDTALQAKFQYVHDISIEDSRLELGKVEGNFIPTESGFADEATGTNYDFTAGRLFSTIHLAKIMDTPLMDFINKIQIDTIEANLEEGEIVHVSAASLFSDQTNLVDGETYTKGKSTNLYQYDNTLLGVNMTGKNLKRFMEWSYTYFNEYQEGDITISFANGVPAYLYDQFDGDLNFTVDLSKPALEMDSDNVVTEEGERINIIEIGGAAFDETATYRVAMNNYRYGSQIAAFGWASDDDIFYDSINEPIYAIRDMLTDYVATNNGVNVADFTSEPTWEFVQYQANGAITTLREGAGKALWNQLQNFEICVDLGEDNGGGKASNITTSVNINDEDTYYPNPKADAATIAEKIAGCK